MPNDEKLIEITQFTEKLSSILNLQLSERKVFRSKGLLAHLLKQKHFTATKYFDFMSDIIQNPDYAGLRNGSIELVKCFNDNIFISIKLDISKDIYYVATMFDIKNAKIESYCKSGRLKKID